MWDGFKFLRSINAECYHIFDKENILADIKENIFREDNYPKEFFSFKHVILAI